MDLGDRSVLVEPSERSSDDRGEIISIVDCIVQNVSIIRSLAGSMRSNHLHLNDWHLMYVISGKMEYFFEDPKTGELNHVEVFEGRNIYTPPNEWHATYFPVDTLMVVSSKNPRDQETYERDTKRKSVVNLENVRQMLGAC